MPRFVKYVFAISMIVSNELSVIVRDGDFFIDFDMARISIISIQLRQSTRLKSEFKFNLRFYNLEYIIRIQSI